MNSLIRTGAALLAMLPVACDRAPPQASSAERRRRPDAEPVAGDKSIMRPAIRAEATPVLATPVVPAMVTIAFAYDSTDLDSVARRSLDALAHDPATAAAREVVVRGHSDAAGSDRANLRVSLDRATVVRDYLVAAGLRVPIRLVGLGERRPLRPSATPDGADDPVGRASNRRVEITRR